MTDMRQPAETIDQVIAAADNPAPVQSRAQAAQLGRAVRMMSRDPELAPAAVIPLLLAREAYAERPWADTKLGAVQASEDATRGAALAAVFERGFAAYGAERRADLHRVTGLTVKPDRTLQARPADFELDEGRPARSLPTGFSLPYCWDLERRELLLTLHLRPESVLAEPFLYTAQRKQARVAARVPLGQLDELFGAYDADASPVFIYSVGRTGSTLMDSLMRCVTPRAVSEPDTVTQLATSKGALAELGDDDRRRLLWHSISPFFHTRVGGDAQSRLSLKFRSQVNALSDQLTAVFPKARSVFMLRQREPWARSTFRAFDLTPEQAAGRLLQGVRTLASLQRAGADLALIWYEEVVADPKAVVERILGEPVTVAIRRRLAETMAVDSQAGTRVSRDNAPRRAADQEAEWMQAFEAAWARLKPSAVLERIGVDL